MRWTDEQNAAITSAGSNVLVSAGAGAGKTAVLVERIKQQIIKQRVPVNELLIVTFTNAAAMEMKEKIRKAIFDELSSGNITKEDDRIFLTDQIKNFSVASISTFHSFALSVIRKYYYVCGISPNFKVAEQESTELLKEEALENLFQKEFECKNEDFYRFNYKFSGVKNNLGAASLIKDTYEFIRSLPYPDEWLNDKSNVGSMQYVADMIYTVIYRKLKVAEYYISRSLELIDDSITPGTFSNYAALKEDLINSIGLLEKNLLKKGREGYEAFGNSLKSLSFSYLNKRNESKLLEGVKEDLKDNIDEAKKQVKYLIDTYFKFSYDEYEDSIETIKEDTKTLVRLVGEFENEFSRLKREASIIDFADIEHFALTILADEDIADEYRKQFRYIYIDEYQDSNLVQEEIISRIKRHDNLFMVGDVKQSIYKFRLAEPEIFIDKSNRYKNTEESGVLINLRTNFRSKQCILESVNYMFSKIMNSPQSGMSYGQEETLVVGQDADSRYNFPVELINVDLSDEEDADEEIKGMKVVQAEALATANVIKENIGKEFFDSKESKVRTLEARDIVILLRAVTGKAQYYQEALQSVGISAFVDESEGYFNSVEIQVFVNLLKIIDNRDLDIPLVSVLKSPIFNFTLEELASIRIHMKTSSYFDAMYDYWENGDNETIKSKIDNVLKSLEKWKQDAMFMSMENLIWKLYDETGYYNYVSSLPFGERRKKNMDMLLLKAAKFQEVAISGIYGFLTYVDMLSKKRINVPQATAIKESENVVRIMTIHKSKGLEFPMVVVSGTGSKLGGGNSSSLCKFHNELGLALKPRDSVSKEMADNLMYRVIENRNHHESIAEEQRILYVALTRPKDKLFIIGASKKKSREFAATEDFLVEMESGNTYLSWLLPLMKRNPYGKVTHISSAELIKPENNDEKESLMPVRKKIEILEERAASHSTDTEDYRNIASKLSYAYKSREQDIKSRYSATEIAKHGAKIKKEKVPIDEESFKQISLYKNKKTAAEKGVIIHTILELINFKEVCKDLKLGKNEDAVIKEHIDFLIKNGRITHEDLEGIPIKKVVNFFKTDAGKIIMSGYEDDGNMILYKERSFVYKDIIEGQELTIIGKIDCLFNINGNWHIVDYKTDTVNPLQPEEEKSRLLLEYTKQMEIYKRAVEDCFGEPVAGVHLVSLSLGESIKVF